MCADPSRNALDIKRRNWEMLERFVLDQTDLSVYDIKITAAHWKGFLKYRRMAFFWNIVYSF